MLRDLGSCFKLLCYQIGNVKRNAIVVDVQLATEDDTREVHLTTLRSAGSMQEPDWLTRVVDRGLSP